MKKILRVLFFLAILCCAAVSFRYAAALYKEKYAPRYLNADAE